MASSNLEDELCKVQKDLEIMSKELVTKLGQPKEESLIKKKLFDGIKWLLEKEELLTKAAKLISLAGFPNGDLVVFAVMAALKAADTARTSKAKCCALSAQCGSVNSSYQLAYFSNRKAFEVASLQALYSECLAELKTVVEAVAEMLHDLLAASRVKLLYNASGYRKGFTDRQTELASCMQRLFQVLLHACNVSSGRMAESMEQLSEKTQQYHEELKTMLTSLRVDICLKTELLEDTHAQRVGSLPSGHGKESADDAGGHTTSTASSASGSGVDAAHAPCQGMQREVGRSKRDQDAEPSEVSACAEQVVSHAADTIAPDARAELVSNLEQQGESGTFVNKGVHDGSTWIFAALVPKHTPQELQAALMAAHDAAVPDASTLIRVQVGQFDGSGLAPYMLVRSPEAEFDGWLRMDLEATDEPLIKSGYCQNGCMYLTGERLKEAALWIREPSINLEEPASMHELKSQLIETQGAGGVEEVCVKLPSSFQFSEQSSLQSSRAMVEAQLWGVMGRSFPCASMQWLPPTPLPKDKRAFAAPTTPSPLRSEETTADPGSAKAESRLAASSHAEVSDTVPAPSVRVGEPGLAATSPHNGIAPHINGHGAMAHAAAHKAGTAPHLAGTPEDATATWDPRPTTPLPRFHLPRSRSPEGRERSDDVGDKPNDDDDDEVSSA